MNVIKIPIFIQHMGNRIIAYILNLSVDDVIQLNNGGLDLDADRQKILSIFIKICRDLRMQGIDQGDVDFNVIHSLPNFFQSGRHIFNLWHEHLGGGGFQESCRLMFKFMPPYLLLFQPLIALG